jgi:tetratricopeptide (TPR) repeat protein
MGRGGYPVVKRQQGRSPMIAKWLSEGLQHHQQGRLAQAEALYRRALEKDPKHPDTLHLLGMAAYQAGQLERAVELIGRAIAVHGTQASYHLNLGAVLQAQGKIDEAAECYERAIAIMPNYVDAHYNLGLARQRQGRLEEAIECHQRVVGLKPDHALSYYNLGTLLHALGRWDEAVAQHEHALALRPEYADVYANLGAIRKEQGRWEEAIAHYERALAIQPNFPGALNNLGAILQIRGRSNEAVACYERAIALDPKYAEARNNLGNVLRIDGKHEAAVEQYRLALAARADFAEVHSNLGNSLQILGRLEEAEACYRRAGALKPEYAEGHNNLGALLQLQGDVEGAGRCFARALELRPGYRDAEWNQSLLQLLLGDFAAGLKSYERRWGITVPEHGFVQPLWTGQPLNGARILLHAEQGLGDTLQFLRYVPMVQAAGGAVVLAVQGAVYRLAQELPGVVQVVTSGDAVPEAAWQCPLLSLPLVLETTLETIPAEVPYLRLPEAALAKASALSWPETGLRVGVVWAGNAKHTKDRYRSMRLSELAPILQLEGVHFFSLQMGPEAEQLQQVTGTITDMQPAIEDMADTAALIAHLDLVIAVDTSVAHLAGALGKRVWMLQPLSPDWRWLLDREDSPWYPGMRLFRQEVLGDWQPVVERVQTALEAECGGEERLRALRLAQMDAERDRQRIAKAQRTLSRAIEQFQAGRLAEAEQLCNETLKLDAKNADGLHLLGLIAYRTRHFEPAVELIGRAIAIRGDQPIYHSNLGNVLRAMGRHDAAVEQYRRAVALAPEFAEARCNLGFALQLQGKLEEAVESYERALTLRPNQVEVWFGLGRTLQDLGRLEEAFARYERVIALQPQHVEAHCQMGSILQLQKRMEAAIARYEHAIAIQPTFAEAHYNLGHALEGQGKIEAAIASYERALELKPEYVAAHNNLGTLLQLQGDVQRAAQCYERTLELKPDHRDAAWNLALVRLVLGDLRRGLAGYEGRWGITVPPHGLAQPQWNGEPLHGARILLHVEQGLGDTLQFLRYVPMVQAAGGSVVLGVQASLRRLALQLPGVVQVIVDGDAMPEVEWQCPLLSLPLALGTTLETIPAEVPYLSIPEAALAKASTLSWPETGLRVGLVWAGNPQHTKDRYRSMRLSALAPILQLEEVHFFSLQMGPEVAQLQQVTATSTDRITDLGPAIEDMADTAALITNLDLVIAVDTSVAHMAGALGKPVWLLLPLSPDWRWLLDRADSPWYPGMRVFRQETLGDWEPVVEQVRSALAKACEQERGR